MRHFDHVILGTGQALGTLLGHLLSTGESIAVIEGGKIGGTCVNTGCTPTKALVASAKVAHMTRRAADYGVTTGPVDVDFGAVFARMNALRDNAGLESWLERSDNVSVFRGWGSFEGPRRIRVGEDVVSGDRVYVNAGTRPRIPDIPGLDTVPWLDNARILDLDALPEHLVVLGGSYVGLEFAQMFRRFGARVTIVDRGSALLGREDPDISSAIAEVLAGEGIEIALDSAVRSVAPDDSGVAVSLAGPEGDRVLTGSHLFVAVGRIPNTDTLATEAVGIDVNDRGYIVVDDHCRTSAEGVFALGDINGRGGFTHTSVNDAEIVLDLMRGGSRRLSDRIVTYGLFVDPPLGRVGMTEREALATGARVLRGVRPMKRIGRAKEMGETLGFAKILVDGDSDRILGAAILGPGGDEIVNMIAAIMYSGVPCSTYRKSVLVHPTVSELLPWILDDLQELEP